MGGSQKTSESKEEESPMDTSAKAQKLSQSTSN